MKAPVPKAETRRQPDSIRTVGTSPVPLALVAIICAGTAAFMWRDYPIYRETVVPALAGLGVLTAFFAVWLAGRRSASKVPDRRAEAFEFSSAAVLFSNSNGYIEHKNKAAHTLLEELRVDTDPGKILRGLGLNARPEQQAGFIRLTGKVVRWRTRVPSDPTSRVWQLDDVTEIIRGHAQIQKDLSVLEDIFDLMPVGFLSADGDGQIDRCNETLATWLGLTVNDLEGRHLGEFITDGYDSGELAGASMGVITLQPVDAEPFIATLMQTAKVDEDDDKTIYTRSLIIRDVALDLTEGVTDEALYDVQEGEADATTDQTESLARGARWLYQESPIGIVFIDLDGNIVGQNAAFDRLFGTTDEPLTGKSVTDIVAREDRDEVQAALSKVVMGVGHGVHLDTRLNREDGQEISVTLTATDVRDDTDETKGLVLHFIDTTEHKNLEIQFTQSQKMQAVGQLAGGVAHDFNNLLTAMIGFSDLLLTRRGPDDPDFADIMQIKQNANRATNLVRQLLAFSRKQKLEPEIVDVSEILGDLSNLLGRLIGERVDLQMDHGRDLGAVLFDKGQFDQVIINLCVNARDAMPDGGKITISTRGITFAQPTPKGHEIIPAGHYVSISVSDTGTGIAKENLDRIFEPFFSTKEVGAGTGLGLSTVYGIVHQTGGYIFVESAMGEGTTFTMYLPVQDVDPVAITATTAASTQEGDLTGHGTVLLVEDEDAVRLFGARALRNKGYDVLEATDGETALDVIAATDQHIDLIISDVVMPGMDGHTLVNLARQELPGVKTILMSGYSEDVFRNGPDMDPSIAFLGKPFTLKTLAAKVKEVLEA